MKIFARLPESPWNSEQEWREADEEMMYRLFIYVRRHWFLYLEVMVKE